MPLLVVFVMHAGKIYGQIYGHFMRCYSTCFIIAWGSIA